MTGGLPDTHELSVLIIEDSESDAELIAYELKARGYELRTQRVDTSLALREALENSWDVVISDFRMPQFNAITALEILRDSGKDIPFILVSQAIGEGVAVELMRAGAADYIMKSSLKRLGPAVEREVREARVRQQARQAAKALEESERRLRAAQQVARLGNWETDLKTLAVNWSDETYRIFGLDPATFSPTHQSFLEYVVPEDKQLVDDAFRASFHTDGEHAITHRILTAAGRLKHVEERWRVERDFAGNPVKAFGTCQDITERFELEGRLQEREAFLDSIIGSQINGIVVVDTKGEITVANESAARILQLKRDEISGRYFQDADYWKQIDQNFEPLQPEALPLTVALTAGRSLSGFEHGIVFPDGSIKWLSVSCSPIRSANGSVIGAVASFLEITEVYMQRERNLQQLQRLRLQDQAINSSLSGVIISDARMPDMPVTYINRAFTDITGYSAEDIIGRNCRFLHRDDNDQADLARLRAALKAREGGEFTLRNYRKDGKMFVSNLRIAPVRSEAGEVTHFVAIQTDITEKFQAQKELEEIRERMELALDGAQLGLVDYRIQAGELFVNERFAQILGYTLPEFHAVFQDPWQTVADVDRGRAQEHAESHFVGRTPRLNLEHRMPHKNGHLVWVQSRGKVVERDDQGNALRYTGTILDITSAKLAEAELNRLSNLLAEAQRIARMGAWELDIASGRTTWTDEVYRIHEVDPGQTYIRDEAIRFYHPDDQPVLIAALQAAIERGKPYDLHLRFVTAKGRRLWVHTSGNPVFEGNRVTRLTGMFQDITAQKQAEIQLQQSGERLALALRGGDLGLWDWDIVSGEAFFDERWCAMLGYRRSEIRPSYLGFQELMHPEDVTVVREKLEQCFEQRDLGYEAEFRLRHKDGRWVWILARGKVVEWDSSAKPLRMVGTHADSTVRKEQEQRILELSQRLIDISEMERSEISSELHDVLGQSLVLTKLNLQKFLGDHELRTVENEKLLIEPLADTLKKAREISRRLTPSYMKKVGLVLALEDMLQSAASLSKVQILTDIEALEGFFPENWSIGCYRVVQESVTNALKHSGASRIEVRARRVDNNLELTIADNGHGFANEADSNGIGLALMRERVRGLRGHLFLESSPTGLTITALVPRQVSSPAEGVP
ncbi:MAG: PAS domain-containing protein [Spirochaetota bacterium]